MATSSAPVEAAATVQMLRSRLASLKGLQLTLILLVAAAALVTFAYSGRLQLVALPKSLSLGGHTVPRERVAVWDFESWKNVTKPHKVSESLWKEYMFHYGYRSLPYVRSSNVSVNGLPLCADVPPFLVGRIRLASYATSIAELEALNFFTTSGGHFEPSHCHARTRVAVVIPFRNRWEHLAVWLLHMHPYLQKQELSYTIYVVNQADGSRFNRGILLNIGFVEANKLENVDCFVFHDVDLLPVVDFNRYECSDAPRHLSAAVDKFDYELPYQRIAGGVIAVKKQQFQALNGYSNLYFGWGGEDDDFSKRVILAGLTIERPKKELARYRMFKHARDVGNEPNPLRYQILRSSSQRFAGDGLSSLAYKTLAVHRYALYTFIDVSIDELHFMRILSGVLVSSTLGSSAVATTHAATTSSSANSSAHTMSDSVKKFTRL